MQEIKKVVIVGAGTMGHSLALLFAKEGFEVNLEEERIPTFINATRNIKLALEPARGSMTIQGKNRR
jgi:3-hydroxyacyl-CoA dehydrogenase